MGKRKEFIGIVVSDKMLKTVVVKIAHLSKHKKYDKMVKRYSKFKVHDEKGVAKLNDSVRITETRPLSKDKRFRVVEVIKKAQTAHLKEAKEKEE
jgi:small subunit ribosomal protein S17